MTASQMTTGSAPELLPADTNHRAPASPYSAYGLQLESELPLPEFDARPASASRTDVHIRFDSGDDWIPAVRQEASFWRVDDADSRFWFRGVAGFRLLAGREILITPEPGVDDALLRMYVEGMMMATLLHQRGFFVLHASVVRIGNTAVALLGHVGAGKSSTAAALHARGHSVVTDDNAAIAFGQNAPLVTPAFPYVKVFPAIAQALGCDEESLVRMHPSQPKFVTSVSSGFPDAPVPLDRIYILTRDAEQPVHRMHPAETIIELVRNSVPTRWKLAGNAAHLQQCAKLAAIVPAFRIRTFNELPELPLLAEMIETHHGGVARA